MRLTRRLKDRIIEVSQRTTDFDAVEKETEVSYETLMDWIRRGAPRGINAPIRVGIHGELVGCLTPFLPAMLKLRSREAIQWSFDYVLHYISQAVSRAERDPEFNRKLMVWWNLKSNLKRREICAAILTTEWVPAY